MTSSHDSPPPAAATTLEVLTRPGCAGTASMLERLQAAVVRLGGSMSARLVDITALPPDDRRRGYPTPTVLVDGRDLFGMPTPVASAAPT